MNWHFIFALAAFSVISVAAIWYLARHQYSAVGEIRCRWFTMPALIGIGIMTLYTIAGLYLYSITLLPSHAGLVVMGIVLLSFYFFFGRAAMGSNGIFWAGHSVPWSTIQTYRLDERPRNRLRLRLRWKPSTGASRNKRLTMVIPSSQRERVEAIVRSTLTTAEDGTEKKAL